MKILDQSDILLPTGQWIGDNIVGNVAEQVPLFSFGTEQMPNTPSAIKRLKQSQKRRLHNRITKKIIKTYTKRTLSALDSGDMDKAIVDFKATVSKIDKAGARRVMHPNTAARRKAKLTRALNAAAQKAS